MLGVLTWLSGFAFGLFFSSVISLVYFRYNYKKLISSRKEKFKKFQEELDSLVSSMKQLPEPTSRNGITASSVSDRLKRVKELTDDQLSLQSMLEIPQKNGLDGRSKNSLSREIKRMEEEKRDILTSILTDGFDPEVSVMTDAGIEHMPLSQLMAQMGIALPTQDEPKTKNKERVKLTVHKGGKDTVPPTQPN